MCVFNQSTIPIYLMITCTYIEGVYNCVCLLYSLLSNPVHQVNFFLFIFLDPNPMSPALPGYPGSWPFHQ